MRRAPTPSGDPPRAVRGRGRFIVFEGIDGAGKTEQCRRLVRWLRDAGHEVVDTREPTAGEWGQRCRDWLRGALDAAPEEVLGFFAADRREHVESVVLPALEKGAVVVSDRYVHSSLAYQAAQGIDDETLRERLEVARLPGADLVLWLRLPVERALGRLGAAATERFERPAFLRRVDAEYARLGLEPIDGSPSADEVERVVRARVEELLAS